MATVNEFRQFANECLRWAAEAQTEEQRQAFLGMARAWTHAALRMEGVLIPDMIDRGNLTSRAARIDLRLY